MMLSIFFNLAEINSRFKRAMFEIEIFLGHSASQARYWYNFQNRAHPS